MNQRAGRVFLFARVYVSSRPRSESPVLTEFHRMGLFQEQ